MNDIDRIKELTEKSINGECSFDERKTTAYTMAELLNQLLLRGGDLSEAEDAMRRMGTSKYPFTCRKCKRKISPGTRDTWVGNGPNGRNVYGCDDCYGNGR